MPFIRWAVAPFRAMAEGALVALYARLRKLPFVYRVLNRGAFSSLLTQEEMLADAPRVNAYAEALPRVIRAADVVLDLGTGSGILAFLAARSGARVVHAVDHSQIIGIARAVADANRLTNMKFHRMHSSDLKLPEKVDVLVHEQMGDFLFEERMVTNIADLRARLVAPGARIVPGRFEFFLEPAQVRDAFSVPYIWEQRIHGVDFSSLVGTKLGRSPEHSRLMHKPFAYDHFLCEPEPLFAFDLHSTGPRDLPTVLRAERMVIRGGRLDGLCACFRAYLDDDVVIDTSPFAQENLSWAIPLLRIESSPPVAPGDVIEISLEADDLEAFETWRWSVARRTGEGSQRAA